MHPEMQEECPNHKVTPTMTLQSMGTRQQYCEYLSVILKVYLNSPKQTKSLRRNRLTLAPKTPRKSSPSTRVQTSSIDLMLRYQIVAPSDTLKLQRQMQMAHIVYSPIRVRNMDSNIRLLPSKILEAIRLRQASRMGSPTSDRITLRFPEMDEEYSNELRWGREDGSVGRLYPLEYFSKDSTPLRGLVQALSNAPKQVICKSPSISSGTILQSARKPKTNTTPAQPKRAQINLVSSGTCQYTFSGQQIAQRPLFASNLSDTVVGGVKRRQVPAAWLNLRVTLAASP